VKVIFNAADGTSLEAEVNRAAGTFMVKLPVQDELTLEFDVTSTVALTISGPFAVEAGAGATAKAEPTSGKRA